MLHEEVGFASDQLHLKKSELGVDVVQLVYHRLKSLVFLMVELVSARP